MDDFSGSQTRRLFSPGSGHVPTFYMRYNFGQFTQWGKLGRYFD